MKKFMREKKFVFLLLAAALILVSSLGFTAQPPGEDPTPAIAAGALAANLLTAPKMPPKQELPVVGTQANLKKLLEEAQKKAQFYYTSDLMITESFDMGMDDGTRQFSPTVVPDAPMEVKMTRESQNAASSADAAAPNAAYSLSEDFSKTNTQVQGVDEADIVKTDGTYIYQVNKGRVVIAKAYPSEQMEIYSTITFKDKNFVPREIYIDEKHMVVIGNTHGQIPYTKGPVVNESARITIHPPPFLNQYTVKAIIFDISNRKAVKELREIEIEGQYISSRKIGSSLYLAANKHFYYDFSRVEGENITPSFRDSSVQKDFASVDLAHVRYFPGFTIPNYLILASLNLDSPQAPLEVYTFLGAGENVYASLQNLYISVTEYNETEYRPTTTGPELRIPRLPTVQTYYAPETTIYKFALEKGKISYTAHGKVPGTVLNQFSMDEYDGHFRLATTSQNPWEGWETSSRNNVYILDQNLNMKGKIEDIAPGEIIYSARFMGKKGYMVTFRTVDPLFVIDLSNPEKPRILGALKIPGFSDYLHPYDENHLIGFGKDTMEMVNKDARGNVVNTWAIELGMKIALFDVSDVSNPVEKYSEIIGGRGTYSELLSNHKALFFSKENNLLAFPVTVMEPRLSAAATDYGVFTFQGAYVYNLDLDKGFQLKGKISHLSRNDYLKIGDYFYQHDNKVERILYIKDSLYTLSQGTMKANRLTDMKETGSLNIP